MGKCYRGQCALYLPQHEQAGCLRETRRLERRASQTRRGRPQLRPVGIIPDESVSGWGLFPGSGVKASAGKSACAWRAHPLRVSWGRARLDSAGYKAPSTFRLCARFCSKVETLPSASDSLRRSCDIIGLLIVDGGCSAIHPIYDAGACAARKCQCQKSTI